MRIGLIDVDYRAKRQEKKSVCFPNLALCKISAWHKSQGDEVVWYEPLYTGHCDRVYVSKVFNFSPDIDFYVDADEVIRGGTGYDPTTRLPAEIDRMRPDYDIYPLVPKDTAYGFLTRGCPNKCRWCVVPKKEGAIHPYMDIEEIATPTRRKVVLMDNNILAAGDYAKEQLQKIISKGYRIDFNQAMDARLVTEEYARLLAQVKWLNNQIRFGCDTQGQIRECERAMELIDRFGFKGNYILYTIINEDLTESYGRINHWWKRMQEDIKGHRAARVYPYAQPYRDVNDPKRPIPQWQKDMARWVNMKAIYKTMPFEEYEPRKGFKCKEYFN
jgi:hypothetical protein